MMRLLRWAFNFTAAVSAVLFVATCMLWVRSCLHADEFHYHRVVVISAGTALKQVSETEWFLASASGRLDFYWHHEPSRAIWDGPDESSGEWSVAHDGRCGGPRMFEDNGIAADVAPVHFGFAHDAATNVDGTYQMFRVPFYAVALAARCAR